MAKQNKKLAQIYHFDLYGKRQEKYDFLDENSINSIEWNELENRKPEFFFVPKDWEVADKYEKGFGLEEVLIKGATGLQTERDSVNYHFTNNTLTKIILDLKEMTTEDFRTKYNQRPDGRDWKVKTAQNDIKFNSYKITKIQIKPFDYRLTAYTGVTKGFCAYPRREITSNFIDKKNIAFSVMRKTVNTNEYKSIFITSSPIDKNFYGFQTYFFPLYLYPNKKPDGIFKEKDRKPNLNQEIVEQIANKLGLEFVPEKNSIPFDKSPYNEENSCTSEKSLHREENSPPLEGCPQDGVANKETPQTSINNTLIKRNFIENLPYNPKLKQLARGKRKEGILSEVLFWQQVHKGKFHKIDFDRQRIIGNYIVDFYVKTLGLVIEIDGSSHDDKAEYDKLRQDYLEALGLRVYRIEDIDVKKNIARVMRDLEDYVVSEYGEKTTPHYGHPSEGEDHPTASQHPSEGWEFTPSHKLPSKNGEFAPIDILDYIYAVLHSPTYREKYKEFLKIDFPRVPYPNDAETFWQLVKLGGEIRQIHLLESPKVEEYITGYPIDGDNTITTKIGKKDWEITDKENQLGRIWINSEQYFENIPLTAWEFYIGGYQPAQKWLKDRKGRTLNFEDILHYQKIIVALTETDRLMKEIDKTIVF